MAGWIAEMLFMLSFALVFHLCHGASSKLSPFAIKKFWSLKTTGYSKHVVVILQCTCVMVTPLAIAHLTQHFN